MIGSMLKSHFSLIGEGNRIGTRAEAPMLFMRHCNIKPHERDLLDHGCFI
jgi:hypothetical protein